jgi:hypothetical protein
VVALVEKSMTDANKVQIDGNHYKDGEVGVCSHCKAKVEHWDWAANLPGLEYAATKYIARWRKKGGLASLLKAVHYIQKRIEIAFPEKVFTFTCVDRPVDPVIVTGEQHSPTQCVACGQHGGAHDNECPHYSYHRPSL